MGVENFGRIVMTVFEKKVSQLAVSGSLLAIFLKPQPYGLDVIAHIVPPHSVKRLLKFSFESYGVFDRTSIWFRMKVKISVRIASTVFEKMKKFTIGCSLVNVGCL